MAQGYKKRHFFETRLVFRRLCVKEPRYSENILAEMCYSIVERVRRSGEYLPRKI